MNGPTLKAPSKQEPEDEGWLITFADMSVLMMCFFIIMFALANADTKALQKVASSLREKGFYNDGLPKVDEAQEMKKQLTLAVGAKGYDAFIVASDTKVGVDVELASSAFFEPGSAKFSPEALPMLQLIARQMQPLVHQDLILEIEGHTDDTPTNTPQYPSNWELSAARAANVVRYLIAQKFPPDKLRAVGRGDAAPKAPNRDTEGNPIPANQNLNRRVVIKLIRGDDY